MTVNQILTPVIQEEFQKYERHGYKIKLKCTAKKRTNATIACGIVTLCGFVHPVFFLAVPIYIIIMLNSRNNINAIIAQAKKYPDMPIDQIVAREIKL